MSNPWNKRILPYPLLAPWSSDYKDGYFGIDLPEGVVESKTSISIAIVVENSSAYLRGLFKKDFARYVIHVSCATTFQSDTFDVGPVDRIELIASNYDDEITVRPYMVANTVIPSFKSSEHAEEWNRFVPNGFRVPAVGILAVGDDHVASIRSDTPESVIDLVSTDTIRNASFKIDLTDERIRIMVSEQSKLQIESIRAHGASSKEVATLFPALYMHAVSEAIRRLSDYPETRWKRTLVRALDKCDIDWTDEETLQERALDYAQMLMDNPMGEFLNAVTFSEEDERA